MARSTDHRHDTIEPRRPMGAAPPDLYDYAEAVRAPAKRKLHRGTGHLRVTDDWADVMPVTEAEVRVIEAYFSDFLDELFEPLP